MCAQTTALLGFKLPSAAVNVFVHKHRMCAEQRALSAQVTCPAVSVVENSPLSTRALGNIVSTASQKARARGRGGMHMSILKLLTLSDKLIFRVFSV